MQILNIPEFSNCIAIINFPLNIELDWPIDRILNTLDQYVRMKAFISIKGHFVDKDICNCLSDENFEKLYQIAEYISQKYSGKVEYITLGQYAQQFAAA